MTRRILCLSRSYLSRLLPTLGSRDSTAEYLHIVQTDAEESSVQRLGGKVVLNLQACVREELGRGNVADWSEPADFRTATGFDWSPVFADRSLPNFPPSLRLKIAGILQRAVAGLFETYEIDGFLSEPVALFVTHLIFYHCRLRNVRLLLWANTYFPGNFYFADNIDISVPARRPRVGSERVTELTGLIEQYVSGVIGDRSGPVYHHAFSTAPASKLGYFRQRRGELPLVLTPGWASRLIQLLRLGRAVAARLAFPRRSDYITAGAVAEHRFYLRSLFTPRSIYDEPPADFSTANVVYPLQYEPEASLLYFAPEIVNQLSYVETLLRALPAGRVLWIKEHPNQFGALGEPRWRELKKRYHNARFVFGRMSGRELIKRAALVVAISSTAGLDGLLLGRKVLVSGKVFYRNFSGAVPVDSYAGLARHVNDPANYVLRDDVAVNVRELVAFGMQCYPGDPQPAQALFTDENLDNLIAAIHMRLGETAPVRGPQALAT